jgi:hypothetical protein
LTEADEEELELALRLSTGHLARSDKEARYVMLRAVPQLAGVKILADQA